MQILPNVECFPCFPYSHSRSFIYLYIRRKVSVSVSHQAPLVVSDSSPYKEQNTQYCIDLGNLNQYYNR